MTTSKSVQKVLSRTRDLPAMSKVVGEVLRATDDPAVDMGELTALIENDPALTAKILRVSNSPYYGMKQHVGTLGLALVLLGVREIRNVVLGVAVLDVFKVDGEQASFVQNLWKHCIDTGAFARQLGQRLGFALFGEDFIAGLLHDIGKVIMWREFGKDYVSLCARAGDDMDTLTLLEERNFGFTHTDAAEALAVKWNLPQTLTDAIAYHHGGDPKRFKKAKDPVLAALVCVANEAANQDLTEADIDSCQACREEAAWTLLDDAPAPIPRAERLNALLAIQQQLTELPPPAL